MTNWISNPNLDRLTVSIFFTLFVGCQMNTTSSTERVPYEGPRTVQPPSAGGPSGGIDPGAGGNNPGNPIPVPRSDFGGSHTGGGNGVDGKVNEVYIRDIKDFPEYRQIIAPRLAWLQAHLPLFADVLEHITSNERLWYFVPVTLDPLQTNIVGVPLYEGNSEQLAVQNKYEIWVAKKEFESMSAEEKATLLMHEMIMGARLMEFQRGYDKCLATSAKDLSKEKHSEEIKSRRRQCGIEYPRAFDFGTEITNSENLTQAVRSLVGRLMADNFQSLDAIELKNWLAANGFPYY